MFVDKCSKGGVKHELASIQTCSSGDAWNTVLKLQCPTRTFDIAALALAASAEPAERFCSTQPGASSKTTKVGMFLI